MTKKSLVTTLTNIFKSRSRIENDNIAATVLFSGQLSYALDTCGFDLSKDSLSHNGKHVIVNKENGEELSILPLKSVTPEQFEIVKRAELTHRARKEILSNILQVGALLHDAAPLRPMYSSPDNKNSINIPPPSPKLDHDKLLESYKKLLNSLLQHTPELSHNNAFEDMDRKVKEALVQGTSIEDAMGKILPAIRSGKHDKQATTAEPL